MTTNYYIENRPWGWFKILLDTPTYKVKELLVKPGARLSYQLHHKRSEHWFVVQGVATATINDVEQTLAAGHSVDVPVETKHRIANNGAEDVIFIEVQTGTYFGEDDIVRLSDDYNRLSISDETSPCPLLCQGEGVTILSRLRRGENGKRGLAK